MSSPRTRPIDAMLIVIALGATAGLIVSSLPSLRAAMHMNACKSNLIGVMGAMYIYAGDGDMFPAIANGARDGQMKLFEFRHRKPTPEDLPSPTADLWMLTSYYGGDAARMICPATDDTPDPVTDPRSVFDFLGPQHLSYAYVFQYHPQRDVLGTASDPRLPVLADANPFLKGGQTAGPSADGNPEGRGMSRNHPTGKGLNIAFADGHVEARQSSRLESQPPLSWCPGLPADNIYTTHADNEPADPGNAPTWTRIQIGSKSDYCLVP